MLAAFLAGTGRQRAIQGGEATCVVTGWLSASNSIQLGGVVRGMRFRNARRGPKAASQTSRSGPLAHKVVEPTPKVALIAMADPDDSLIAVSSTGCEASMHVPRFEWPPRGCKSHCPAVQQHVLCRKTHCTREAKCGPGTCARPSGGEKEGMVYLPSLVPVQ
jgi:hypothetical protein